MTDDDDKKPKIVSITPKEPDSTNDGWGAIYGCIECDHVSGVVFNNGWLCLSCGSFNYWGEYE
jgi:hypothetical protein